MHKYWLSLWLLSFCLPVAAQQITLNLKEVEFEALIQTVSEVTKKNFIVDERVKGKVTVISASPMDENELYEVFLSILNVHGFSAVPAGKVIKIVPEMVAKTDNTAVNETALAGDEVLTQIIAVKYVSAAQLVPVLRPLLAQQSHLAAYPDNNTLIISDRAGNIERLLKIIRRLDQPDQSDIEVVMLEHATATEVVRVLSALTQKTPPASGAPPTQPQLAADERTNSV